MAIPAKVEKRLSSKLNHFQKILKKKLSEDINESDTSTIIQDVLADLLGYDKYADITSEFMIRGTYCDLAVKLKNKVVVLIECKAIGIDLKDMHVKQAVDYASNQGIEWTILTNGRQWQVFRIVFGQPIDKDLVLSFDFTELKARAKSDIETLFLLTKESIASGGLNDYYDRYLAVNKYSIAAVLQLPDTLWEIRKQLRKAYKGINVTPEEVQQILIMGVLKREVLEDEKAIDAKKRLAKQMRKAAR